MTTSGARRGAWPHGRRARRARRTCSSRRSSRRPACPRVRRDRPGRAWRSAVAARPHRLARSPPRVGAQRAAVARVPGGRSSGSHPEVRAVGVVAAITPYNFPFITNVWKLMPALMTGCTRRAAAEPAHAARGLRLRRGRRGGRPAAGVLNIVVEQGAAGGERPVDPSRRRPRELHRLHRRRAHHRGAGGADDEAGDPRARGQERAAAPARRARRRARRRGGAAAMVFTAHAGQGCALQTRMLVPHDKKAEVLDAVGAAAASASLPADPHEASTMVGPLITEAHRVSGSKVSSPKASPPVGASSPAAAGPRTSSAAGSTLRPSSTSTTTPTPSRNVRCSGRSSRCRATRDVDEAIAIANDSEYGLSGGVYTDDLRSDVDRGADPLGDGADQHLGRHVVHPDGWVQASGIGRERGVPGVREFQELKHMVVGSR